MTTPLTGVFTPHLTPFQDSGEVDEVRFRGYIDWLIEKGVTGLFPAGSTGEFVRCSETQWRSIVQIVCEHARGRVPIVAGAASPGVQETIERCQAFKFFGVDALVLVAPYYFPISDDAVFEYFDQIASAVDHPIFLYHIPALANPISVGNIVRLAEKHANIIGVKDSCGDVSRMAETIHAVAAVRDDFQCLTGYDAALAPMMAVGATGGMVASSGVVPEIMVAIHRHMAEGRIEAAMDLQRPLVPLFNEMLRFGEFPDGFRLGASARGWDLGPSKVPSGMSSDQRAEAAKRIETMVHELLGLL